MCESGRGNKVCVDEGLGNFRRADMFNLQIIKGHICTKEQSLFSSGSSVMFIWKQKVF